MGGKMQVPVNVRAFEIGIYNSDVKQEAIQMIKDEMANNEKNTDTYKKLKEKLEALENV
ncbi:MAG: hypothetical protein Tp1124SUR1244132_24 [Prokaryotic dsDNA virus sp.]|nr:MAG: hypothetical protein Tp1124SUR1244132_24 [Prokaryotic dsDNA virus sp.]|tara:strand:- start:225 stop:401 length:177 start_codon:yes stop_codon:yes gene_type:complete